MRTYWKHCNPTQSGGQFKEMGPSFISAVQVSSSAEKQLVDTQKGKLERSGIFGKGPIVTQILHGPRLDFDPIPADQRETLKALKLSDPKK
jgi:peptide methionine sulfoxide reductase MsrA